MARSCGRAQTRHASVSKATQHAQAEWVRGPLQDLNQSLWPCLSDDSSRSAKVSINLRLCDRSVLPRENQSRPDPRAGQGNRMNCSTICCRLTKTVASGGAAPRRSACLARSMMQNGDWPVTISGVGKVRAHCCGADSRVGGRTAGAASRAGIAREGEEAQLSRRTGSPADQA